MATRTHGSPELDADAAKLESLGADAGLMVDDLDFGADDDDLEANADLEDKLDAALDPNRSSLNVGEMLSGATTRGLSDEIKGEKLSAQSRGMLEAIIVVAKSRCENEFLTGSERSEANLDLEILHEALAKLPAEDEPSTATKMIDLMAALKDSLAGSGSSLSIEEQKPEPTVAPFAALGQLMEIPIGEITPDPDQPREAVDDELAGSIAANGVLQPIVVRPHPKAGQIPDALCMPFPPFMLVDGERRWRGARKADLATIPARVMTAADDDGDRLLHQVVFNEGKRLTPMEEARSWKRIMTAKKWTAQQLAKALGRGKSTVSDRLALIDAPPAFQKMLIDGTLTAAAAPIIRQYAHLPASILDLIVEHASDCYEWRQTLEDGKALDLKTVARALANTLNYPFTLVDGPGADYPGETFEVNKKRYAVDRQAYEKRDAAGRNNVKGADDYTKRQAEHNRERAAKKKRTVALRTAQFDAITEKLPTTLDANGALFVTRMLIREMQLLSQAAACRALGIVAAKSKFGSPDYDKALIAYATKLNGKERVVFLLQIAMAGDLQVSEYEASGGGERLSAAAALVKLDLKKVKAPVDEKSKVAAKPAAKSAKASTAKKRR